MPTYVYHCDACEHEYEEFHSMSETRTKCPACGREPLRLVPQCPIVLVKGNPTTVGQQAEMNARRMGKEQLQKMAENYQNDKKQVLKLPEGATKVKPPEGNPWWREGDKPLDLKKVKDVNKYIRTGDKN